MNYKIPQNLAQSILNYLAKQPYADVFELIAGMQSLEKLEDKKLEGEDMKEAVPPSKKSS